MGRFKTAVPSSLTGLTQFPLLLFQPLPSFTLFPVSVKVIHSKDLQNVCRFSKHKWQWPHMGHMRVPVSNIYTRTTLQPVLHQGTRKTTDYTLWKFCTFFFGSCSRWWHLLRQRIHWLQLVVGVTNVWLTNKQSKARTKFFNNLVKKVTLYI